MCENGGYEQHRCHWRIKISSAPDTVIKLDLGITPESGAPMPVVLQSELRTILIFDALPYSLNCHGYPSGAAIIEFKRCLVSKFGYPNDEALPGHPLYDRGLDDLYGIFEVLNPTWLAEINDQNRVSFPEHQGYAARHFIVVLHDSTFECLARDIDFTWTVEPMKNAVAMIENEFKHREYRP